MQYVANKYVRISDISAYLLCPRLAYFRRRKGGAEHTVELVRAAVFKELSRSLASALATDDPEAAIRSQIEVACNDAEIVYGLPTGPVLEEAIGLAGDIIEGLHIESGRIGRNKLMTMLSPCERSQAIYSDRLRISGHVDRIVMLDAVRCPVVICASKAPERGIYAADRLKLAACAMLMEEKYGAPVGRGMVEYVCGWRIREADIRKYDRMAVLSARNRIVQAGSALPDARRGTWCVTCQFSPSCDIRPSLVSSLFSHVIFDSSGQRRQETNK
jgi:CRISPR-associated exonuclease Cas4